jgi:hypothetical protein
VDEVDVHKPECVFLCLTNHDSGASPPTMKASAHRCNMWGGTLGD